MKLTPFLFGILLIRAVAGIASPAAAMPLFEQDFVRVEGQVTSISGSSIYVDRGRDDRIEVGDRVVLHPAGVTSVEGTVRSVSKSSARLELDPGSPSVALGTRVELLVPRERTAQPAPTVPPEPGPTPAPVRPTPDSGLQAPPKPPPVHPPWTHPPESWSADQPLLAPAFGRTPEERESELTGRAWLDLRYTKDEVGGSRSYLFGRMGTNSTLTNPFGDGGELRFDAELLRNDFTFDDEPTEEETDFVLRRFSYSVGGTRERPTRFEAGRFLAREFPELGVVDGVEWTRRTDGGHRFGAHAGGMPESLPDELASFDDTGVSVFGRWVRGEKEELRLGGALQNTWHDGEHDRTLVLAEAEWRPSSRFWWRTLAWVDFYDSGDALKSEGLELTELSTQARWRSENNWGVNASASRRLYPELLREDYAQLSPALVQDGELARASLGFWRDLTRDTRVDARADVWNDQDDSGSTLDVGMTWRDLAWDDGSIALSAYRADGSYSSGYGARATATKAWSRVFGSLAYDYASFDQKDFTGEQATLAHHAVYGTLDLPIGEDWTLTLQGDTHFGDEQDAWSLGFALQMRF